MVKALSEAEEGGDVRCGGEHNQQAADRRFVAAPDSVDDLLNQQVAGVDVGWRSRRGRSLPMPMTQPGCTRFIGWHEHIQRPLQAGVTTLTGGSRVRRRRHQGKQRRRTPVAPSSCHIGVMAVMPGAASTSAAT
ncbi:hypothetical protein NJL88_12980 [Streptomyces sp. DK15]|uniref:hypothetical protein n=1 Tax=Streptomyces sp. DK15 TaxID=2957499 RepID=UPI0029A51F35|nr:hypothetical protein [Streptomyces sp. DK15]MDX2390957.1 hypothetical protein [Streptomyces sp. DK15]